MISLRPPEVVAGEVRTIAKCARQDKCGVVGEAGNCVQVDLVLGRRATIEKKGFVDKMIVYDVVHRAGAAKRWRRAIRTRWVLANKEGLI